MPMLDFMKLIQYFCIKWDAGSINNLLHFMGKYRPSRYYYSEIFYLLTGTTKFTDIPFWYISGQNVQSHASMWKYWLRGSESVSWNPSFT